MNDPELIRLALEDAFVESFKAHFCGFCLQIDSQADPTVIDSQIKHFKRGFHDMMLALTEARKVIDGAF